MYNVQITHRNKISYTNSRGYFTLHRHIPMSFSGLVSIRLYFLITHHFFSSTQWTVTTNVQNTTQNYRIFTND